MFLRTQIFKQLLIILLLLHTFVRTYPYGNFFIPYIYTSLLDCVTDRCVCHACWLKFQYTKVKITVCINIYASRLLHLSLCVCFKNI